MRTDAGLWCCLVLLQYQTCAPTTTPLRPSLAGPVDWGTSGDPMFFVSHPAVQQWPASAWTKDYVLSRMHGNFTNTYTSERRTFPYFDPSSIDASLFRHGFAAPFIAAHIERHDFFKSNKDDFKLLVYVACKLVAGPHRVLLSIGTRGISYYPLSKISSMKFSRHCSPTHPSRPLCGRALRGHNRQPTMILPSIFTFSSLARSISPCILIPQYHIFVCTANTTLTQGNPDTRI